MNTKRKKNILVIYMFIFITLITSCQKKNRMANYKIENNIDYYNGWVVNRNLFVEGKDAHSGNKYVSLGKKNAFGPRYRIKIEELVKLKKVNIEFYVRNHGEETKALYVFQIQRGDSNIYWKSFNINNVIDEQDEWVKVKTSFNFSNIKVEPNDIVSLYPWVPNKKGRYDFDDFSIEFK